MTAERITEVLSGPHQAILSVSRPDKGPVAVPMSYVFDGHRFVMITPSDSLHGRLLKAAGRATVTVHHETGWGAGPIHQWYVMAEGPARFTDEDPHAFVADLFAKDRGTRHAAAWARARAPLDTQVAELVPDRIAGYESVASLP